MRGKALWMVSFAFCFFVFLQVKSNGVVIVTFSFVLTLDIGLCFLFFYVDGVLCCCLDDVLWSFNGVLHK
jgi:hypothetical protein